MKILQFIAFFLALVLGRTSQAQTDIAAIEKYIEKARVDWGVPGMSVAIVKEGKIVSNRGYGVKQAGENAPVDKNTLYAIASNTKAFVSSSLAVLHQQGKVSLDDKVQDYIPGFKLYDAYASSEATIRDLLCHRAGLGTYSGDVIWYKSNLTADEVVEKIQFVPRAYSFRGGYGYSNLMFITAGEVVRKASGVAWNSFVKKTFFDPLAMDRSITSINELRAKGNYAIPHKPVAEENVPIAWTNWDNMGAAGGIISSSTDMAKWMVFQLNNGIAGQDTILHPAVQNILWTPHNNYTVSIRARQSNPGVKFSGYGLGWSVSDYFGNRMITHGGGYDGMYSQVAMIPEQNLGIVILTNTMKGIATPLRYYIINQFIQEDMRDWSAEALLRTKRESGMQRAIRERKESRVVNTKSSLPESSYAGKYQTDMLGPIHIVYDGDDLFMNFENSPELTASLEHWHYDTWEIKWDNVHAWFDFGTIKFELNSRMEVTGFEFDVPNNDIFFHELDVLKK